MKPGDVVFVKLPGGAEPKARILRKSKRTGYLTLELIDSAGAYAVGSNIQASPHECRPAIEARG